MLQQIRFFFENLSGEKKVITTFCGVWGWFCNLFLLDAVTLWEYIIKAGIGLCSMVISVFLGLVIKDFYAIKVKPKLFKNGIKESNEERA